jgi:hypothetical protein
MVTVTKGYLSMNKNQMVIFTFLSKILLNTMGNYLPGLFCEIRNKKIEVYDFYKTSVKEFNS